MQSTIHVYEVRPRKDKRGVDLISDALPFGRVWYGKAPDAIGYAAHHSRSHDAVIRVYDEAGNVIRTHERRAISKSGKILLDQALLPAKTIHMIPLLSDSSPANGRIRRI